MTDEWEEKAYKYVQFKLPTPLHEEFYKAFPGRGERSLLLRRFVVLLLEDLERKRRGGRRSVFVERLLREVEMDG